jgi:hypothetical protein
LIWPKYRQRNIIERMFGWEKENRRIVTRLDKLAKSYAARVSLACSMRFLRHLFSYGAYEPLTCEPKGNNQQRDHLLDRFGSDWF